MHESQMFGEVEYYGPGEEGQLDWLGLLANDPTVESGSYSFIDSNGTRITLTIACDDGIPCPRFKPLPTGGDPPAPPGGVGFDAAP